MPAISACHIAFVYADDLWVCDLDGGNARRLTSDPGVESNPAFSPDGRTLAFTGQYDGNTDVYTIPVDGGVPTRLTWHPAPDLVRGWTPDGRSILFDSPREAFARDDWQLFTVPIAGGFPTKLPIPRGYEASYSPDGTSIAYTPIDDYSEQWKHYRGGAHSRIWIMKFKDYTVEQIPQPSKSCNDTDPRWLNDTIYFRSDRNGLFNLFAYQLQTKSVQQLTYFDDFPVMSLNVGGDNVVFEQSGFLHRFDLRTHESQRLKIAIATDLPETRARFVKGHGTKYVRNGDISPSGTRVVLEFRGEIISVPTANGEPRNLTNTPGVHERSPCWSPDGASIAYFSDASGKYALHVRPADGKGGVRVYAVRGSGFYESPVWSPDSKKIAYTDSAWTLYWVDLESGQCREIAAEPSYGPARLQSLKAAWSPDSRWIAYARRNLAAYRTIFLYSLAEDKSRGVTDGWSDATEPHFDASGNYLYFFASTDAGPVNAWYHLSNRDARATRSLYLAVLKKDAPSPFARRRDEETARREKPGPSQLELKKGEPLTIDFDDLQRRIVAFPIPAGDYRRLETGAPGQVFYLAQPVADLSQADPVNAALVLYELTDRKRETILASVSDYRLTPDGRHAYVYASPEAPSIVDITPGQEVRTHKLDAERIDVKVDPAAEWRQIFDEAWRINRDYFYDPNMHGADWIAIKKKYEIFLPHLTSSSDLYRVIRWMLSELSVGHSYTNAGERFAEPRTVPVGLLGADFEIADGRYRFTRIYRGSPWWPRIRAPLSVPGADVKAGEFLLAVGGSDLRPSTNVYSLFENAANKGVDITVGPNPDSSGSRSIIVEPLATPDEEFALRHLDWVEGNARRVNQATRGRVAYVYVPDTGRKGLAAFEHYFYAQLDKDAIIIDERFNAGGTWPDYYLDHMRRRLSCYETTRHGMDLQSPTAAILGPKVMLINETSGSGGDLLAWMFRQSKLGLLVGKRTWGGSVGLFDYPVLMDGGSVTAPNFAHWSPEGGWIIENEGVPPDIEVEQWPAKTNAGQDPQLEAAITTILKELDKHSRTIPQRPPYPVRAKISQ
jgi:tricorn protease